MERKEPCQGCSTSPASISALGLPGCGVPTSQVIGTGGCSREGGHRQNSAKAKLDLWWFTNFSAPKPRAIWPFQRGHPKGTCPQVMLLRAWTMAGHRICVSPGQTHPCKDITSTCRKATSCLLLTSVLVNSALNHWSSCGHRHNIPKMSK